MQDVCAVADLKPHEPFAVRVGNAEIVLTMWRDKVYAVRNVCPHQGQSFVCGNVVPQLTSSVPGEKVIVHDDHPVLLCPWHTWGYELETGRCVTEPTLRVRRYDVEVRDGRVLVDL